MLAYKPIVYMKYDFRKKLAFPWQPYANSDVTIELTVVDLPNPGTTLKAL